MKKKPLNTKIATTSERYEEYIPWPSLSSVDLGWQHVIVRYYHEPNKMDLRIVPSLPDLHIVVILSASLEFEQKSEDAWIKTPIKTGDVFIVPPHTPTYQMRWENKSFVPIETLQIFLDKSLFTTIASNHLKIDYSDFYFLERDPISDNFIYTTAIVYKKLLETKGLGESYFAASLAHSLAIHVLREHAFFNLNKTTRKTQLPAYRLQKVQDYIRNNLSETITIDQLSQIAGMSVFHFSRLFKSATNFSPNQYIIRERIREAKNLLQASNASLSDIAYQLGFQTPSHFSTQFRKVTGQSPSDFRK